MREAWERRARESKGFKVGVGQVGVYFSWDASSYKKKTET